MRIAGKHTVEEWTKLKKRLESATTSQELWDDAYRRFYRHRIETRYLRPIDSIERHDTKKGEGFAVAALFCSLIEFLESCEKGDNFRFLRKGEKLRPNEYTQYGASRYFKDFLKTREPFKTLIPPKLVESFYSDVRCGLLHEARTKGGWIILAPKSHKTLKTLVSVEGDQITLFRNRLLPSLKEYFDDYKKRLRNDPKTQNAFIRKFDHLCKD